jgi:hypothetical protein
MGLHAATDLPHRIWVIGELIRQVSRPLNEWTNKLIDDEFHCEVNDYSMAN